MSAEWESFSPKHLSSVDRCRSSAHLGNSEAEAVCVTPPVWIHVIDEERSWNWMVGVLSPQVLLLDLPAPAPNPTEKLLIDLTNTPDLIRKSTKSCTETQVSQVQWATGNIPEPHMSHGGTMIKHSVSEDGRLHFDWNWLAVWSFWYLERTKLKRLTFSFCVCFFPSWLIWVLHSSSGVQTASMRTTRL